MNFTEKTVNNLNELQVVELLKNLIENMQSENEILCQKILVLEEETAELQQKLNQKSKV